jgi:hypothetical protein
VEPQPLTLTQHFVNSLFNEAGQILAVRGAMERTARAALTSPDLLLAEFRERSGEYAPGAAKGQERA